VLHYLKEAGYSLYSTLKGLKVTGRASLRAETTVQYPDVRPDLAPRFRGFPDVDLDTCIVCHLCEKVCPTQCIHIEDLIHGPAHGEAVDPDAPKPEKKKKEATVFNINAAICMVCGLCEEICPTKPRSIILGHHFEMAKMDRSDLVYGIVGQRVDAPENPPKTKA
jgi:NADH-quinone oxidoreductase subunit I